MVSFSTRHIDYIERNYLDELDGKIEGDDIKFETPDLESIRFLKVLGISKKWERHKEKVSTARHTMADVLAGLYGNEMPFIYLLIGEATTFHFLIGTFRGEGEHTNAGLTVDDDLDTMKTTLRSTHPGIDLETCEASTVRKLIDQFDVMGFMTGTPTTKVDTAKMGVEQIERLMRGLYGRNWGYMVVASPLKERDVTALYNSALNELRIVTDAQTSAKTTHPIADRYMDLLKTYLKKMSIGKMQGMWHVAAYLICQDAQTFNHAKAVAKSVFGGRKSLPDPIRVLKIQGFKEEIHQFGQIVVHGPPPPGKMRYPYTYLSTLNSEELASLGYLPTEEMPGYFVKDYARFDVASHLMEKDDTVKIGEVLDQSLKMGYEYQVRVKNFDRHTLIVGITGTGKTNTCFHILKQLWRKGIPFMVIEPAKTEYRKLLQSEELGKNLQIFTLGDESVSPFRINPFEIIPGTPVQSHIDHLKSVFNASFVMYAPMPYVLEQCIHEVYEDKGWDLVTNENERGMHRNAHPTLTDLYRKVDELVDRLGYEERVTMDVKAALRTRINSLRVGSKGSMLDVRKSLPVEKLLGRPTIIELDKVGDDDEKAFLIGLILMSMYEFYASKSVQEGGGLNHVTIIEEAHRLLTNVPLESYDYEAANIKGKAVEAFCNILSEVRAYGEGFLILEQIPSKLAPDAIKNTNLKITHRVVAMDDRTMVGGAMNMEKNELARVASLAVGEAVVYGDGDDSPLHVKVPYSKIPSVGLMTKKEDDTMVREAMKDFLTEAEEVYIPFEDCHRYCGEICKYKKRAQRIVDDPKFQEVFSYYVLSVVEDAPSLIREYPFMVQSVSERRKGLESGSGLFLCTLIQAVDEYFEGVGRQYGWMYSEVQGLKEKFMSLQNMVMKHYGRAPEDVDLTEVFEEIRAFQDHYKKLCARNYDPFAGCNENCADGSCLYRYNVQVLLEDADLDEAFIRAITSKTGDEMWRELSQTCEIASRRVISDEVDEEVKRRARLCYAIQKSLSLPNQDWRFFLRDEIVTKLKQLSESES